MRHDDHDDQPGNPKLPPSDPRSPIYARRPEEDGVVPSDYERTYVGTCTMSTPPARIRRQMKMMPDELLKLSASDPDLAQILDVFAQVDAVYQEALKATGAVPEQTLHTANSAAVTVSFDTSAPGVVTTNR